jgi:hypothetical protein
VHARVCDPDCSNGDQSDHVIATGRSTPLLDRQMMRSMSLTCADVAAERAVGGVCEAQALVANVCVSRRRNSAITNPQAPLLGPT